MARPLVAAVTLLLLATAAPIAIPSTASAVPHTSAFRSDDASLLGVVDSVQSSILTVVAYPPSDGTSRSGKKKRLIGTALATSGDRIITSASVAIPGGRVRVLLGGGVERPATLQGVDRQSNLALFKVEGATLRPLRVASPRSLAVGSWVAVVSNVAITRPQAALGRILGRGERIDFVQNGAEVLEIDAPSYPGVTGGAVLNEEGEWVAVVVGRAAPDAPDGSRVGGVEIAPADAGGMLIALPVEHAAWIANELERYGAVRHGFLGIQLRRATAVSDSLGVLVAAVIPGSPADSAGFLAGDRILAIDGEEAHGADELTAMVRAARPGDEVEVTVLRKNEIFPIRAVVGAAASGAPIGPRSESAATLQRKREELERLELERRRLENEIRSLEGSGSSSPSPPESPTSPSTGSR
ncbi:MAG TPA: trypsin-like peptidase domain-containing protein [Candidatus Eisenbacteria bacterium]|nr:trypsin-like peptidase domain-containing protein [Candidatus Eisenbacteria bacterium]